MTDRRASPDPSARALGVSLVALGVGAFVFALGLIAGWGGWRLAILAYLSTVGGFFVVAGLGVDDD